MHSVSQSRTLHASKEQVWAALDDFGGVWKYNPGVESSRIVNDTETGQGACRECVLEDGGRIEETITEYSPGEGYTVEFTDMGSYPLVSNTVDISVRAVDDDRTEVTMSSEFVPKYGPVGWLMAKVMMKGKFAETFDEMLAGLEDYLQTTDPLAADEGERTAAS